MRHIIFSAMLFFMLASCSQQANEYNQTIADSLMSLKTYTLQQESAGSVSVKEEVAVVETANAMADSTCGCVHEELSEEESRDLCRFKIGSPIKGYESYREEDSIVCYYNKWTYSPDAEYVIKERSESGEGCGGYNKEVYRNGIKVKESHDSGCGDCGSTGVTYYYADGTVAYENCSRVDNGVETEYYSYEKDHIFSQVRLFTDEVADEDGAPIFRVVRLSDDTLTICYQLDYNGGEYDVETYLVAEKGEPAPYAVKLASKGPRCPCVLSGVKFVKRIK